MSVEEGKVNPKMIVGDVIDEDGDEKMNPPETADKVDLETEESLGLKLMRDGEAEPSSKQITREIDMDCASTDDNDDARVTAEPDQPSNLPSPPASCRRCFAPATEATHHTSTPGCLLLLGVELLRP